MMRALLLLLVLSLSSSAWAQSAVELAKEAKSHYDRGEWPQALALFQQAEVKAHSPVLVLYAARCQRNLGKLVEAEALLEEVVVEELAADAPGPFRSAQTDAKKDLEALKPRIPSITIDRSQAPSSWVIRVDGADVSKAQVPVNPGGYLVTAHEGAAERFRQQVEVAEGSRVTVTVLDTSSTSRVPSPTKDEPKTTVPSPDESGAGGLAPGLALIGVGAAGLAVGIALRVLAVQQVDDVKSRCVAGSCLQEDEAAIDEAVTFQTVSTVLFIAGGALAATGIVLLIVLPTGDDAPQAALGVHPTGLSISGSF